MSTLRIPMTRSLTVRDDGAAGERRAPRIQHRSDMLRLPQTRWFLCNAAENLETGFILFRMNDCKNCSTYRYESLVLLEPLVQPRVTFEISRYLRFPGLDTVINRFPYTSEMKPHLMSLLKPARCHVRYPARNPVSVCEVLRFPSPGFCAFLGFAFFLA